MFVVRVETDEALMFRTFRKLPAAKAWAVAHSRETDAETFVDVFDVAGVEHEVRAIEAIRDGQGKLVISGEKLLLQDFRQSSSFLAGIGIGTGASF